MPASYHHDFHFSSVYEMDDGGVEKDGFLSSLISDDFVFDWVHESIGLHQNSIERCF
jgi:hypothetical protein